MLLNSTDDSWCRSLNAELAENSIFNTQPRIKSLLEIERKLDWVVEGE